MSILDEYKKAAEEDEKALDSNPPIDGVDMTAEETDAYKKRLSEMRQQIKENEDYGISDELKDEVKDAMANELVFEDFKEKDLKIETVNVMPIIKRAYCPKCGKEIVNRIPTMYNPFTFEQINRYVCDCGWKANLPYSYPHVTFVTDNGEQIDAFAL